MPMTDPQRIRRQKILREAEGYLDLITVFGDLRWHAIGSLGWNTLHVFEEDLAASRRTDEDEDV